VFTADSLTADCELRSIDTGVQNDTCSVDDPSSVFTDPKPFELRNNFDAIVLVQPCSTSSMSLGGAITGMSKLKIWSSLGVFAPPGYRICQQTYPGGNLRVSVECGSTLESQICP